MYDVACEQCRKRTEDCVCPPGFPDAVDPDTIYGPTGKMTLQSHGMGDLKTYTISDAVDAVRVKLALPWGDVEVQAMEAFLALTPEQRMKAIEHLGTVGFLAKLVEDHPGVEDLIRRGPDA